VTETQRDAVQLLSADHRDVDRVLRELESLRGHSGAESLQRRRALLDEEEVQHSKEDHAEAEEITKRLERADAGFDATRPP
jgi:hypothetical protein